MAIFTKPAFNTVWAATGVKVAPSDVKISQGWIVEIPPYEYDNWAMNRLDAFAAHVNQVGIVSWDGTVEYQAGKSYVQSSLGTVYRALKTHTNANPETDTMGNWEIAFERSGTALLRANNLSDVPDKAQARSNLGILGTADYDLRYLIKSQNFADVPNKASARNNLGLGDSATMNIGVSTGTVASGDDPRIVNSVQKSQRVSAGLGLTGGGSLTSDVTISMGTPSHISSTSENTVIGGTHTHKLDVQSLFPSVAAENGHVTLPGGIMLQWGTSQLPALGNQSTGVLSFPTPFPNQCFQIICTSDSGRVGAGGDVLEGFRLSKIDRSTFRYNSSWEFRSAGPVSWFAIGN